jgi:hypothetical protein
MAALTTYIGTTRKIRKLHQEIRPKDKPPPPGQQEMLAEWPSNCKRGLDGGKHCGMRPSENEKSAYREALSQEIRHVRQPKLLSGDGIKRRASSC